MRFAVQAPRRTLLLGLVLTCVAGLAALTLTPGSPTRLLAGGSVQDATTAQEHAFGDEPIVVSLSGDLDTILAPDDLKASLALEQRIAKLHGVRTVYGPGTFVDQAVGQMASVFKSEFGPAADKADKVAALAVQNAKKAGLPESKWAEVDEAARLRSLGPLAGQYQDLLVRFGSTGLPSLDNPDFVAQLVKGPSVNPKQRFAWLFPDAGHALILIRPAAGLSDASVRALGRDVRGLVAQTKLPGVTTTVAGAPLVVADSANAVSHGLTTLLPFVALAMLLMLLIGLGWRARAVQLLAPAVFAVALTAGLSGPLGLELTPATLAALPVIMGLALDYAVQLQVRFWAERRRGLEAKAAATAALERIGPTLALAGGAMIAGFLVLAASPIPLMDRLGFTLPLGVAASLAGVYLLGVPLLLVTDRAGITPPNLRLPTLRLPGPARLAIFGVALGVTVAGLVLSGSTDVQSDLRKLVNPSSPELARLEALQQQLGTSGNLRVAVTAPNVTDPKVLNWMAAADPKILALDRGLKQGPNLAAMLTTGGTNGIGDKAQVDKLLGLLPPALTSAVLTRDRKRAELSYGVPLGSVADQAKLIDRMRAALRDAPPGVHVQVAGLLASSAAGVTRLQDERPWLLLVAALIVLLLLFAVRRSFARAAIPVAPALLAAGATAVLVRIVGAKLSPLSAGLDPLVLAVGVEFGVLLEARYREERTHGQTPERAAALARRSTGAAVLVAAAAVALGFSVLVFSDLPVLKQFGLFAAIELVFSVGAALALVPTLAALTDVRVRAPEPVALDDLVVAAT